MNKWATHWKMNPNPDTTRQAKEVIFSRETKQFYPSLLFNNDKLFRYLPKNTWKVKISKPYKSIVGKNK